MKFISHDFCFLPLKFTTGSSLISDFVSFLHQILAYLLLLLSSAIIARNLELYGLTTLIRNPWTIWQFTVVI